MPLLCAVCFFIKETTRSSPPNQASNFHTAPSPPPISSDFDSPPPPIVRISSSPLPVSRTPIALPSPPHQPVIPYGIFLVLPRSPPPPPQNSTRGIHFLPRTFLVAISLLIGYSSPPPPHKYSPQRLVFLPVPPPSQVVTFIVESCEIFCFCFSGARAPVFFVFFSNE